MCELFSLSSRLPTRATFSLRHFAEHGAPATGNIDGWGVAFHDGFDARLYKEPEPAGDSPWLAFIETRPLPTRLLISHIRRATRGPNTHANTQPFAHALGGRMHLFAHNGGFDAIDQHFTAASGRFHPVGQTDSEMAFCLLLERLAPLWAGAAASPRAVPSVAARRAAVTAFAADMRPLGIANFLYSDGDFVFGHGHRRTQANGIVSSPGLWCRHRHRHRAVHHKPGVAIDHDGDDQEITMLASVPVTGGKWRPLDDGEIVVIAAGELVTS
jgi:predicted glutamine amidotransferase